MLVAETGVTIKSLFLSRRRRSRSRSRDRERDREREKMKERERTATGIKPEKSEGSKDPKMFWDGFQWHFNDTKLEVRVFSFYFFSFIPQAWCSCKSGVWMRIAFAQEKLQQKKDELVLF